LISVRFKNFVDTYQEKSITSGTSGTIFEFNIPAGYRAFIYKVKINGEVYDPDVYINFKIDDEIAEKIERWLVDRPTEFDPPYLATYKIEFIGYNNSNRDYKFGIFCDGKLFDEGRILAETKRREYLNVSRA